MPGITVGNVPFVPHPPSWSRLSCEPLFRLIVVVPLAGALAVGCMSNVANSVVPTGEGVNALFVPPKSTVGPFVMDTAKGIAPTKLGSGKAVPSVLVVN